MAKRFYDCIDGDCFDYSLCESLEKRGKEGGREKVRACVLYHAM
jgi:hypothetical protein